MKKILDIDVMKEMGVEVEGREEQKTVAKKNGSIEQAKSNALLEEMACCVSIGSLENPDDIIRSWRMQAMGKNGIILRWDIVYTENGDYIRRIEDVQTSGDIFADVKKYYPEARKYFR